MTSGVWRETRSHLEPAYAASDAADVSARGRGSNCKRFAPVKSHTQLTVITVRQSPAALLEIVQ